MKRSVSLFKPAFEIWLLRMEALLKQRLSSSETPLLGLYLDQFTASRREPIRKELDAASNPFHAYRSGLERWPAVFAAYLTSHVVDSYGAAGNGAMWPYIADAVLLGKRQLSLRDREILWQAYRRSCIRLGLEVIPKGSFATYQREEFLHQAGVPARYLDLLTERMLHHAKLSGTPDADDPKALALWCNALLERLGPPVPITVARAIEADRGGFYARLFLRVLAGEDPGQTDSEHSTYARMAEVIAASQTDHQQLLQQGLAIPQVVWRDELIGVELPAGGSTEWLIDVDGQEHTYRGASEARFIPLDFPPLPGRVQISRGNGLSSKSVDIWGDGRNNRLVVFDEAGALVGGTRLNAGEPLQVEPGLITLVMRFQPDGAEATLSELCLDPQLYAMSCDLAPGEQLRLQRGPAEVTILARSRPTLALSGQAFRGVGGNELYASVGLCLQGRIPVELWADDSVKLVVAISISGSAETLELPIAPTGEGTFELDLESATQSWTPGLVRLRIELRRAGVRRAMARLATWLWVGLTQVEDRSRFCCNALPLNLDAEASDNLARDESQHVLTYRSDAKRFFRIVFQVGAGRSVQFTAAVPGAFMVLKRYRDGQVEERSLRKGTVLALRADSREVLDVYSTQGGVLRLGRMRQEISPRTGLRRLHLSMLAEYLEPDVNQLSIELAGYSEPLLRLVVPHRVLAMNSREEGGVFQVQLDLPVAADALRWTANELLTGQQLAQDMVCNDTGARLDRSALGWLTCSGRKLAGQFQHTLEFPLERWQTGAWLLQVEARLSGQWGSLVNERQDVYAWGFLLDDRGALSARPWLMRSLDNLDAETRLRVFKRIHQALLPCYAPEAWPGIRWLADAWQQLVRTFVPQDGQLLTEILGLDAQTPPETSQASWFPLLIPGVALPWIYAARASAYRGVGARAGLLGRLSQLHAPLNYLFVESYLEQTLAFGFNNVLEMHGGAPPVGFSFARYREALSMRNIDGAWSQRSREDWRPTEGDYLGPVHWRYAWSSLGDRYHATLTGNATRRGWAMHLVYSLDQWKLSDLVQDLPSHLYDASGVGSLRLTPGDVRSQEQLNLDMIDRLLCLFAAVCRWESRVPVLASWHDSLQLASDMDPEAVSYGLGYLLYVGRDVFEFYLMLWELVFAADADTIR